MKGFAESKSFLFVFENSIALQDKELIYEFASEIKAEKKDVFFLIYHNFKKVPDGVFVKSFDIHVSKGDFNILKKPSSPKIKQQINLNYDYLISFVNQRNTSLENFIRRSRAEIKIGRLESPNKPIYRITFGSKEKENSIEEFLKITGNYLTKIRIER